MKKTGFLNLFTFFWQWLKKRWRAACATQIRITVCSISELNFNISCQKPQSPCVLWWVLPSSQPEKSLKSNTGGVSFCWIGIEYAVPYNQKYTPSNCFFCNFIEENRPLTISRYPVVKPNIYRYLSYQKNTLMIVKFLSNRHTLCRLT